MKSPFPGMDPYLERRWESVHMQLAIDAAYMLNASLPPDLVARPQQRVAVESTEGPFRVIVPDVYVHGQDDPKRVSSTAGGAAVAEPVVFELLGEPATEKFIQIMDVSGEQVITVIEFLSPSNKRNPGLTEYLQKRDELIEGHVNVVEIDLVRAGDWHALIRPGFRPRLTSSNPSAASAATLLETPYRVLITRANDHGRFSYYPISLRLPLPAIPIPLRPTDADVTLELQPLLDGVYERGRYAATDYTRSCEPPIGEGDATWVEGLLEQARR